MRRGWVNILTKFRHEYRTLEMETEFFEDGEMVRNIKVEREGGMIGTIEATNPFEIECKVTALYFKPA